MKVWLVGDISQCDSWDSGQWQLLGLYLDEARARERCSNPDRFLVPITVDQDLDELGGPPYYSSLGGYFPSDARKVDQTVDQPKS